MKTKDLARLAELLLQFSSEEATSDHEKGTAVEMAWDVVTTLAVRLKELPETYSASDIPF